MNSNPNGKFLVDGFPRNENNLQGWKKHMEDKVDCKGVLFFNCPEDVSMNYIGNKEYFETLPKQKFVVCRRCCFTLQKNFCIILFEERLMVDIFIK